MDANSHRTTSLFSGRGDLLSTQDALAAFTSWQYDAVGNPSLRIDARNWPTSYTVDALNRTVGQDYIDGTRVTRTFDAADQQLTQLDLLGVRSFGYDLDGRQTSVAFPTGLNLTHTFDPVSNRLSTLDPDNGRTSWSYDQQNRIVGIANPFAELTTIVWDALDREQRKTLANGMVVSHTFDVAGRELLLENRKADGTGLAVFTNTYDPVSNRLSVIELDGTLCTFGYDPTYQLINEQRSGPNAYNTTYLYDPLGNRLSKNDSGQVTNYQYNQANELTLTTPPAGAPTTATFDANGNLALENSGGALTSYSWDPENRLLTVSSNSGTESYSYSADSLRQKKAAGPDTTNYVWDEQNIFQERDASLAKIVQYTDSSSHWGALVAQRRGVTSSFYGFDSQSSTRVLTSIGGGVTDRYSYSMFGEELATGSGTANPYRYVGLFGYYRDATLRQHVSARVFAVANGRWMSRDPAGFGVNDWNLYLYVRNSPVSLVDPSGLAACKCCCCASYLKVQNVKRIPPDRPKEFTPPRGWDNWLGHYFEIGYGLNYVPVDEEDEEDCSMEWWEKSNLWGDTWKNQFEIPFANQQSQQWLQHRLIHKCPDTLKSKIWDIPAIEPTWPKKRTLTIRVVLRSAQRCIDMHFCENHSLVVEFNQTLSQGPPRVIQP